MGQIWNRTALHLVFLHKFNNMADYSFSYVLKEHMRASVDHFVAAVNTFCNQELQNVDQSDPIAVRKTNDKLM